MSDSMHPWMSAASRCLETIHDYIPVIVAAMWPGTVIFLALWFRKEIRSLLNRLSKIGFGSNVIEFGAAAGDVEHDRPSAAKEATAPSKEKWHAYWLGSDLEWTSQTALRGAPKERIIHGLTQSEGHSSALGLGDSPPGKQLSQIKAEVLISSEASLHRQWRIQFGERITEIVRGFDALLSK